MTDNQQILFVINVIRNKHGIIVANNISKPIYDTYGTIYSKMFTELFPYGREHPGEKRVIPVSVLECVKYYLELSSRRFVKHHQFLDVAFDHNFNTRSIYIYF